MSRALLIRRAGPGVTVQDMGRPGHLGSGLSRGGAADTLALWEGAALLGQPETCAALELAGMGGSFAVTEDTRIALTGAPMSASRDGAPLAWNASHLLRPGEELAIGPTRAGVYGYLHLGGGIATAPWLGARAVHTSAGIGAACQPGDSLPLGQDAGTGGTGLCLPQGDRFSGGAVRLVPSVQTSLFPEAARARFVQSVFSRDARGNRMGVRLIPDGPGFGSDAGLTVLSEVIVPGDVQITGDGTPFVLLADCQTTGGYPRIGSVLPCDLPRVAQAAPGTALRFVFVAMDEALTIERAEQDRRRALRRACVPLVRDPATIPDLLSYQLISGVTAGAWD